MHPGSPQVRQLVISAAIGTDHRIHSCVLDRQIYRAARAIRLTVRNHTADWENIKLSGHVDILTTKAELFTKMIASVEPQERGAQRAR